MQYDLMWKLSLLDLNNKKNKLKSSGTSLIYLNNTFMEK